MAIIGIFTPAKDGGWTGTIRTFGIDARCRFVPNDNQGSENAPVFRVMVGQAHLGDVWAARSRSDPPRDYFRVRLDDPFFREPIVAAFFPNDIGDRGELLWARQGGR